MERIVLRTQSVPGGNSSFGILLDNEGISNLEELEQSKNCSAILLGAFKEQEDYSYLLQEYNRLLETGESSCFCYGYRLSPRLALKLDAHITICRVRGTILKWIYSDRETYLADTWWFQDEEILNDLSTLSCADFFEKYM